VMRVVSECLSSTLHLDGFRLRQHPGPLMDAGVPLRLRKRRRQA